MNWQLCDPSRPTTVVSGGPGRRRWEIMRLPDESLDVLNTAETAWRLLEPWGMTPATAKLERHAVYRFMAGYAEPWRRGRVFLAGDAAHLMPPFAGEGMCNGLRDVANLAWKLDLVLSGRATDGLLDTYQAERLDNVRQWIEYSVALGEVICVLDEEEARARDERMIAGDADPRLVLPAAPPTRLGVGLFVHDQPLAGTQFIQGQVAYHGKTGLFDEVVGRGFALLARSEATLEGIGSRGKSVLATLGAHAVALADTPAATGNRTIGDLDGEYARWFASVGCEAVLVRPDFTIFGLAQRTEDVTGLIESLSRSLSLHSALLNTAPA